MKEKSGIIKAALCVALLAFVLSGCVTAGYMDRAIKRGDEKVFAVIIRGGPSIGDQKANQEWEDYWIDQGRMAHYKVGMRQSEDLWDGIKKDWKPSVDWLKAWWEKYKDRDTIGGD
jgi:hypothetical protein